MLQDLTNILLVTKWSINHKFQVLQQKVHGYLNAMACFCAKQIIKKYVRILLKNSYLTIIELILLNSDAEAAAFSNASASDPRTSTTSAFDIILHNFMS